MNGPTPEKRADDLFHRHYLEPPKSAVAAEIRAAINVRDSEWVLAFASALGTNSKLPCPIMPSGVAASIRAIEVATLGRAEAEAQGSAEDEERMGHEDRASIAGRIAQDIRNLRSGATA